MTCEEVRAYLDTSLAEDRQDRPAEQVLRHIADCPGCARYLEDLAMLERQLQELPVVPADPAVLPAVMSRVRQARPQPALAGGWQSEVVRWLALAAGLAICVAAYHGFLASGEWFTQLLSLRTQPAGLVSGVLRQAPSSALLSGIAALLAASAILWHGSRDGYQASLES